MEGGWQAKLPSTWPSSPPGTLPLTAPPPPIVSGSASQEPFVFSNLNLSSSWSGQAEVSNPILALLSGDSHQLSSTLPQFPNSASVPTKLSTHSSDVIISSAGGVIPISGLASSSENHGNDAMGNRELPFVTSKSKLTSRTPISQNNLQLYGSCHHTSDSSKTVHQAFQGNNNGMAPSSTGHEWRNLSMPTNAMYHQSTNHGIVPKSTLKVKSAISNQASVLCGGHLHVFCLNTVGKLFLSDVGLLGVLCLCHSFPMSVAKFCEHSGSSSVYPGDAVHLENGLTVAQWFHLSFGIRIPDNDNGWDWPDGFSPKSGPAASKANNFPLLLKNLGTSPSETFCGLKRYGEQWNNFVHPSHSSTGAPEQVTYDRSVSTIVNNDYLGNASASTGLYSKNFTGSAQCSTSAAAKSQAVHAGKEAPVWIHRSASVLALHKREQSAGHQTSVSHTSLGSKKSSLAKERDVDRGKFLSETFWDDRNGVSSNIELRLGQPSHHNQTFVGPISSSVHPSQPEVPSNSHKSCLPQPLMCSSKLAAECAPEINKIRPLWSYSSERSSPNSRLLQNAIGKEATTDNSETDLMDNSAKNSAISLFLSHLNYTEGNNTSNIVDECENYMSSTVDDYSLTARCNLAEFIKNDNDVTEGKSCINVAYPVNPCEKRKDQNVDVHGWNNILGHNSVVDDKLEIDTGGISELGNHRCYCIGDSLSYLYPHQQPGVLNVASNAGGTKHCGKFPLGEVTGHHKHLNYKSTNAVHVATRSGPLDLQIPSNIPGTNSCFSGTQSSLTNKQRADNAHHSVDENLILLALRHGADFSKLELSNTSTETSNLHARSCCLSAMTLHRNGNKDATATSDELRQMPCCSMQQGAFSHFRSVHSRSNSYCGAGYNIITGKPGVTGPNTCSCSGLQPRISLCCKEHDILCPMCHPCGSGGQALLRNGRSSNNVATEHAKREMCVKERIYCSSGQCCHSFPSNCLTGPCFSRDEPFYGSKEQCACDKAKINSSITHDVEDDKRLKTNQIDCFRKHAIAQSDCQIAFWRDVPNRVLEHSKDTGKEKSLCVMESDGIITNKHTVTAVKEFDCTYQESKPLKERQVINVSSGPSDYSAPAATEISVKTNDSDSFSEDYGTAEFVHDFTADEESQIEKCGSSDYPLDCRFLEVEEHVSLSSSKSKDIGNKSGAFRENLELKQPKRNFKVKKRKGPIKWRSLNDYLPLPVLANTHSDSPDAIGNSKVCLSSLKETEAPIEPSSEMQKLSNLSCKSPSIKRKRSTLSSIKSLYWKRFKSHQLILEDDKSQSSSHNCNHDGIRFDDDLLVNHMQEPAEREHYQVDAEVPHSDISLCGKSSPDHETVKFSKKPRPIVCGNLGVISDGLNNQQKPAKILSLKLVMKNSKRCEGKDQLSSSLQRKSCPITHDSSCNDLLLEEETSNGSRSSIINNSIVPKITEVLDPVSMVPYSNKVCLNKNGGCVDHISMTKKVNNYANSKSATCKEGSLHRYMETRKRSLSKLMGEDKKTIISTCSPSLGEKECYNVIEAGDGEFDEESCSKKIVSGASAAEINYVTDSQKLQHGVSETLIGTRRSRKGRASRSLLADSDAFCCVCGSSNNEEIDRLLECSQCLIRVHQACYGVSKVPKGHWYCRPCKVKSKNIVCVLCGYGGGAMTRALKSRNIVRSLLKVWKVGLEFKPMESFQNETRESSLYDEASRSSSGCGSPRYPGTYYGDVPRVDLQDQDMKPNIDNHQNNLQADNTIINGVYDPCITQWVHMVCGLWTPGTRCPNVDTMNAFDVSGASPARNGIVCSICNRPGGACIRCRVINCSIHFHPWCAHQKGLLQSETEGVDNENVGFYGRCLLHATYQSCLADSNSVDTQVESPRNKEFSCARIEGFRGRKREEGFNLNFRKHYKDGMGCIVTQAQINAWIFINGQKSFLRGPQKVLCSDVEHDFRKEYIRYKQMKGWKRLVVYKSGIHALGLYTSQFIVRGAMVINSSRFLLYKLTTGKFLYFRSCANILLGC
ncbi:Histone-lysine N-methyltransferase protein [Dioscorea alata]|uniref:Histone-lysine N-methyltransferase protein n=1 Tax=Dioscorea alata TaxID=55571 RepID=A0ACB7VDP5_DIOAL|nr:Histone-lysine N-methyltransferase protein [Dioscorea alata]